MPVKGLKMRYMYIVNENYYGTPYAVGYYKPGKRVRFIVAAHCHNHYIAYGLCSWLNGGSFPPAPFQLAMRESQWKENVLSLLK